MRVLRRYYAAGHIVGGGLFHIPQDADRGFDEALNDAFARREVPLVHVRAVGYGCFHFEVRRP